VDRRARWRAGAFAGVFHEDVAVGVYEQVGMRPIVVDDTYQLELAP
jgi:hypothetical protein